MPGTNGSSGTMVRSFALSRSAAEHVVELPDYDRERLEDIGFLTAMTLPARTARESALPAARQWSTSNVKGCPAK